MITRRHFIQASSLLTGAVPFSWQVFAQNPQQQMLKIPDLQQGQLRNGVRHYQLQAGPGNSQFFTGIETPTLGFNGDFLGPTLRLRNGESVSIDVANGLGEDLTVHWHGLHLPAAVDGGPHQIIAPGGNWSAEFRVNQNAGPFWYHSHVLHYTGEHVYRGLAGMILLEDEQSLALDLPSEYGVDDIPLIIQDRLFDSDGSFRYLTSHPDVMFGMHGDTILVNGTLNPIFIPKTGKVRFRLMNASNARIYTLGFSDGRPFQQIACDGGFLQSPLAMTELVMAPAERCEIVVDFSDGAPVDLVSRPLSSNSPFRTQGMMGRMHSQLSDQNFQILAIEPQANLAISPAMPSQLPGVQAPETIGVDRRRRFELGMAMGMGMMGRGRRGMGGSGEFYINGQSMDMSVINERIPVGSTEIWEIHNGSAMVHPFHIHHGQFRVWRRNGRVPHAHEQAFKDTVKVAPGETVEVLMEFADYADPEHAYMYHCHILEHEDNGMMGQFVLE